MKYFPFCDKCCVELKLIYCFIACPMRKERGRC
ncbi:MAG: hypothetical protein QOE96_2503 [Blastocatellia bacterium]|nr:hypothetical protein [Blastocatellia bacterium]